MNHITADMLRAKDALEDQIRAAWRSKIRNVPEDQRSRLNVAREIALAERRG